MIVIKAGTRSRRLSLYGVAKKRYDDNRATVLEEIESRRKSGVPLDGLEDPGEFQEEDHGLEFDCAVMSRADVLDFRMRLSQAETFGETSGIVAKMLSAADFKVYGLKDHHGSDLESDPETLADQLMNSCLNGWGYVQDLDRDWPARCG